MREADVIQSALAGTGHPCACNGDIVMTDKLAELWCMRSQVPTPLGIAFQLGSLEQVVRRQGGTIRSVQESTDALTPHLGARLPDSLRQGGSVPAIWARANGQDTRVIGITWMDEYQAIVALPHSGIRGPADLAGRKIGIPLHDAPLDPRRASALRAFQVVLAAQGMALDSVQWVDLPDEAIPALTRDDNIVLSLGKGRRGRHSYTNEARALARGEVDAVYMKDVRGAQTAHMLGAHTVVDIGSHPDPFVRINNGTPRPLTVNGQLLDRHPQLVRALLAQVLHAGDWARREPAGALTLISRETGWAEPWIRHAYGETLQERLRVDLSDALVDGLAVFKDFLFGIGVLPADFDVRDWIDPEPLADVLRDRQAWNVAIPPWPAAESAAGGTRLLH